MPRGGARKFRFDRETINHDEDGNAKSPKSRRKFLVKKLKQELHVHEYWTGRIWQYKLIFDNKNLKLCGTDACLRITNHATKQ